ncbi:hypothetical protein CAEBREN_10606 [Caenorhabditis brenneri]|uniref:Uncharacterized protein n=1 Tax=Caenorhabditis brenneri TaxID=135651 RepID=G0NIS9_CAEBE|nr:hypothetical protein CAEBREN_10606 [Caenorhabditis brenneri]
MSNLLHILLIPIGILATAVILKSSGAAIYRKNVNIESLDDQVREEIRNSFYKTMSQLSHFEMDVPTKISIRPMKNEEGNTFNEPFLVGNLHEIRAHNYMPPAIDEWCSGVVSKHTQFHFEHNNRRITVVFDCNRRMVFPSLRTIVGWCLVALPGNAVIIAVRIFAPKFESVINRARNRPPINEKPISFDDYIVDDEDESVLMYLEGADEKWDASKLESCYD